MIDLKLLKDNPDLIRRALAVRGESLDLDEIIRLDHDRRNAITEIQQLKSERNKLSEQVGESKQRGEDVTPLMEQARSLAAIIKEKEVQLREIEKTFEQRIQWIPNIPHDSVPVSQGSGNNAFIRGLSEPPPSDFPRLMHWEIGEALDILDLRRAARLSGSRFLVLKQAGAFLERVLINYFLDVHTNRHGYREIAPPVLNTADCLFGTGQLPKLEDDMYKCVPDGLYLCPTAEVPLTNLHREEIIPEKELPLCYTAYTPCFRREAGSYGKDVRGIKRVHQFDKVELVKYTTPEQGYDEFEKLLNDAEHIVQKLDLPYRIMLLSTGDMTFAAAKTYDIEVYAMGMQEWLEVSSVSIYEQFQARRANIRFRRAQGGVDYVYTMNGSGLALPRIFIAILENFQTKDGRVRIPDVLKPYFNDRSYLE